MLATFNDGDTQQAERLAYELLQHATLPLILRAGVHTMLTMYDEDYLFHAQEAVNTYQRAVDRCRASVESGSREPDHTDAEMLRRLRVAEALLEDAQEDADRHVAPGAQLQTVEEWLTDSPEMQEAGTDDSEVGEAHGASVPSKNEPEAPRPATQRVGALPTPAQTSDPVMPSSDPATQEAIEEEAEAEEGRSS